MMVRLSFLTAVLFSLVACKPTTTITRSTASAPPVSSCLIGRWSNSALPLSVKMSSEFSADYTNADLVGGLNPLEQMAQVWNAPVAGTRTLITTPFPLAATTGYASSSSFRDSEIGIYKSHSWFANVSANALAITQFYGTVSNSPTLGQYIEFSHADIIVNYRDFGSDISMTNSPLVDYDLPTIVLHEMGHLLGLCHETSQASIMAPYYVATQRSLQTFDANIISDLYVANQISHFTARRGANALSSPVGTEVKGVIELHADGRCEHYINGKKIYEHRTALRQ